jgi:regulator of cell morphogenesis and NO signaling
MTAPSQTLADLVAKDASRARVLDRLGLDYCCGGDETLDHACARVGLDVAAVVAEIDTTERVDENHNCEQMKPAALVQHLIAVHHTYLHSELPDLERIAQKVLDEHGGRHTELHKVRAHIGALRDDLESHMLKEERVLFPAIVQLLDGPAQFPFGSIANPIKTMGVEHDRAGDILTRLRATTNQYIVPDDACASYRSLYERLTELEHDTHLHIFEENHLLFPAAAALEAAGRQ